MIGLRRLLPPAPLNLVCGLVCALTLASSPALAATGPGTRVVKRANQAIARQLSADVAPGSAAEAAQARKVTQSVRGFLDIDELGKRALRDSWDQIEPAKREEFLTLLRGLVEASYIRGLRANLNYAVAYVGEKKRGSDILVETEIRTKRRGRPYTVSVDYVLRKDGSTWRAYDVITDEVGLVENYRAQFRKIIAREGFDGLLARLRKKASKGE